MLSHSQYGETVNNLIGRTLNPVNQLLSCGGSSGGTKLDIVTEALLTAKYEFCAQAKQLYKP